MARSQKETRRGKKPPRALPKLPTPAMGDLVSSYGDRKNTNAGKFERLAGGETPPNDRIVKWSN